MMTGINLGIVYKNMAFARLEDLQRRREEMINAALSGGASPGMAIQVANSEFNDRIEAAERGFEHARLQLEEYENRPRWWHFFTKRVEL